MIDAIPPGFSRPASSINRARSCTKSRPSSNVMAPVATAAVNSPMECPAIATDVSFLSSVLQRSRTASSHAIEVTNVAGCWLMVRCNSSSLPV